MHGNVREWLEDCWLPSYNGTQSSPWYYGEGGNCGDGGKRILRGGAWDANMQSARSANRFAAVENRSSPAFGVRIARDIE